MGAAGFGGAVTEQLAFDLPVRVSLARGDFFVSDANALAVARLDAVEGWPNAKLVLVGPEGSGKTHLAHVWAEAQGGQQMDLSALGVGEIAEIDAPVFIECPGEIAMGSEDEETLFHLHNHMAAQRLALLLVARTPPSQWDIALPDLKSRMVATDIVRISEPDDALLSAVLVKLFADRQLQVAPSLIGWLAMRMDRSFAEAQRVVAALDALALSKGGAITRPLAQLVLDRQAPDAP